MFATCTKKWHYMGGFPCCNRGVSLKLSLIDKQFQRTCPIYLTQCLSTVCPEAWCASLFIYMLCDSSDKCALDLSDKLAFISTINNFWFKCWINAIILAWIRTECGGSTVWSDYRTLIIPDNKSWLIWFKSLYSIQIYTWNRGCN